jgi:hypothetical protein
MKSGNPERDETQETKRGHRAERAGLPPLLEVEDVVEMIE